MEVQHEEASAAAPMMQSPPSISHDKMMKIDGKVVEHNNNGLEIISNIDEKSMCIIDVKNDDDDDDDDVRSEEKVCRICQLSSDHLPAGAGNVNLVVLGCGCRGELGISHYHCASLWFQQKGNRTCEICGKPAKNIGGIEDTGFRAYGTDIGIITSADIARMSLATHETTEHRRTKSLCNFLLAALVLAFLLPWALHPNKLL